MRALIPLVMAIGYSITDILSKRKVGECYHVFFLLGVGVILFRGKDR